MSIKSRIGKKVLSFITAFAIVGAIATGIPFSNDKSSGAIVASATGDAGNTGSNSGGGSWGSTSPGKLNTLQGVYGIKIYPYISENGYNVSEFSGSNRHTYEKYALYMQWSKGSKTPSTKCSYAVRMNKGMYQEDEVYRVYEQAISNQNRIITSEDAKNSDGSSNAFYNAIKGVIGKDITTDEVASILNEGLYKAETQKSVMNAWAQMMMRKSNISTSDSAYKDFEKFKKAAQENKFALIIELCGGVQQGGKKYLVPLCYYPTLACYANGRTYGLTESSVKSIAFKEEKVRQKVGIKSFGCGDGNSCYSNAYNNTGNKICAESNHILFTSNQFVHKTGSNQAMALGTLRPGFGENSGKSNLNNEMANTYGGWGLYTFKTDPETTKFQLIKTSQLVGVGTDTEQANNTLNIVKDRVDGRYTAQSSLDEYGSQGYSQYFENEDYGEVGQVGCYISSISDVYAVKNKNSISVSFPNDKNTKQGLTNTKYTIAAVRYRAVLSDGSNATQWYGFNDVKNNKSNTIKLEDMKNSKGESIVSLAKANDKDIFVVAKATYIDKGLGDEYFKAKTISANKLTERVPTLMEFLNSNNMKDGSKFRCWVYDSNTKGALYSQVSDASLPNLFTTSETGMTYKGLGNKSSTKSSTNSTYFFEPMSSNEIKDGSKTYFKNKKENTSPLNNNNSIVAHGSMKTRTNNVISRTSYTLNGTTTPYRYTEASTDGGVFLSRAKAGDNLNYADYSKFNYLGTGLNVSEAGTIASYGFGVGDLPAQRKVSDRGTTKSFTYEFGFVRNTGEDNTKGEKYSFKKLSAKTKSDGSVSTSIVTENGSPVTITWDHSVRRAPVDTKIKSAFKAYVGKNASWSASGTTYKDTWYSTPASSTLKFYPEVEMQYDSSNTGSGEAYMVGDGKKTVKPMIYNELTIDNGSTNIDSTAIAVDSRAKALAKDMGYKNTPVYLPGGVINGTTSGMNLSVTSYIIDVDTGDSSRTNKLKSDWGMSNYDAKALVRESVTNAFKQAGVRTELQVKDGNTVKGTYQISDGSDMTNISYDDNKNKTTLKTTYYLTIEGNKVTGAKDSSGNAVTLSDDIISRLKINDMLNTVMEVNGGENGWYNEDSSVLAIKVYTTKIALPGVAFNDKLPLDAGPATASDKNSQYNKGYTAYLNATVKFKDNNGNERTFTTSSEGSSEPAFIIPNVTVIDIAQ